MPIPHTCPNPSCSFHIAPPHSWLVRYGRYASAAHGPTQRYRCRGCRHTLSDQTESIHYFAKRRLPLYAIWSSLLGGSSLREIGRRYGVSRPAVQNALLRLGRQAMAAQILLLSAMRPRSNLVFDGLRSFVTAQDYPCDITTVVEPDGETILTMTHTISRRGGTMTPEQRLRADLKYDAWSPSKGSTKRAVQLIVDEMWDYLRPVPGAPGVVCTDEHPLYRAVLRHDAPSVHFRLCQLFDHIRIPGSAPRTRDNPLFSVNYVDRMLRHRLKEHTRETIAFGKNAVLQMHRAWIFACDHNLKREYRVKRPRLGCHAIQSVLSHADVELANREFYKRRLAPRGAAIPESIHIVWTGGIPTPPVRWKSGQKGTSVRIPKYALRDLLGAHQHAD